jgi:phage terminase large subunit GpA-like protein
MDSGRWQRFAVTAPSQQGKTLLGSLIPLCYHLFEVGERVVFGVPDMDMAADKWRDDILPMVERTRFRDFLPRHGGGSRGGRVKAIKFTNGAVLRFMSAGGRDKSRAGYPARVLVATEVDGFDEAGSTSRESDKIKQLEARLRAHTASRRRTYLECTVSVKQGRIWQEYSNGSAARIMLRCPHCQAWVSPEREHLLGWQDAADELTAREGAHFSCPDCGHGWTEAERRAANQAGRLVHRGQEIDPDGQIHGPLPRTQTLGFRWSAVNNLFCTPGDVGMDEWRGRRAANEDNAEKELRQFVWCIPWEPPSLEAIPLNFDALTRRIVSLPRGRLPPTVQWVTVGVDLGKRLGHYVAIAWCSDGSARIVDYARFDIASDDLGPERATLTALRELRDVLAAGWSAAAGPARQPDQVWIDCNWHASRQAVYAFCRESNSPGAERYFPLQGFGQTVYGRKNYSRPKKTSAQVRLIGEEFHVSRLPAERVNLVECNVDHWKTWVHQRLATPQDSPGALSLFAATPAEHTTFVKHLLAEKQVSEFVAEKGTIYRWDREHANNHYLDATTYAAAAGWRCGFRLVTTAAAPAVLPAGTNWFAQQKEKGRR